MSETRGLRAFHNARLRKQLKRSHNAGDALAQAQSMHQAGLVADAQRLCRLVLERDPRNFQALHLLGIAEYQNGRHAEAERLLKQALQVEPRSVGALSNCGIVLHALGRFTDALACYDAALAVDPQCAEALSNGANALSELGRFEEAVARYDKALAARPGYVEAYSNRANALYQLRRFTDALASCDTALSYKPDDALALMHRGNALTELARFNEALASYDRALAIDPHLSSAWLGRGNIFLHLNRYGDASAAFQQALAAGPNNLHAMAQLAHVHERYGRIAEAVACYDRALGIKPDFADAISNKIFTLDFAPDVGVREQQDARKYWWQQIGSKIAGTAFVRHDNDPDSSRRIRVGYVSSDFRRHSAAATFRPVLRNHDKTRFEVMCYSCSAVHDERTAEFQQIADRWVDAAQLSDQALADRVRADGIDILVDLSGHSAGHRLGAFARKPAPVQVTAWGHATGTGIEAIDYLFSDPVSVPPNVRRFFAEAVYDLPCVITTEAPPAEVRVAAPPVLRNGHVTFGVFNRVAKVSDDAIAVWARILELVAGARLLMKDVSLDDADLRAALCERFTAHGVDAERIDFLGYSPREQHLAAFAGVDICLDPFPQNGGVSTWEALHMGVPVVAKLGHVPVSRLSGAILSSIGMCEWVAASADEYVAIAGRWASLPGALRTLRGELSSRIANSASGNSVLYTRAVEQAYRTMWEDYCRKQRDARPAACYDRGRHEDHCL